MNTFVTIGRGLCAGSLDSRWIRQRLVSMLAAMAAAATAQAGLSFNITYTAAVQANPNFASIQTAVNYVANEYSTAYTDNITLNFTVDQNSSGLGQSLFSNAYWRGSYAALRAALVADAKTANDAVATAAGNLPAADPYGAGATGWYATSAEAKALGLIAGNQAASDGTYTFNSTVGYTYNPANRGAAGLYDFIGVTEHEFSELMGRTSQIRNTGFGYDIFDTMRFTNVGVRDATPTGTGVYYSFNNGATALAGYNSGSGDIQDFNGAIATDPFNASTGTGQAHSLSTLDYNLLDVIGYDQVPAPSSLVLLAGGGLLTNRRRRR